MFHKIYKEKKSIEQARAILKENKMPIYKNKKIPLKWQKLFSIKIFAKIFFEYYNNKLVITNLDIYSFFRKKGYIIDEESPYDEIIQKAKMISQEFYIKNN